MSKTNNNTTGRNAATMLDKQTSSIRNLLSAKFMAWGDSYAAMVKAMGAGDAEATGFILENVAADARKAGIIGNARTVANALRETCLINGVISNSETGDPGTAELDDIELDLSPLTDVLFIPYYREIPLDGDVREEECAEILASLLPETVWAWLDGYAKLHVQRAKELGMSMRELKGKLFYKVTYDLMDADIPTTTGTVRCMLRLNMVINYLMKAIDRA